MTSKAYFRDIIANFEASFLLSFQAKVPTTSTEVFASEKYIDFERTIILLKGICIASLLQFTYQCFSTSHSLFVIHSTFDPLCLRTLPKIFSIGFSEIFTSSSTSFLCLRGCYFVVPLMMRGKRQIEPLIL